MHIYYQCHSTSIQDTPHLYMVSLQPNLPHQSVSVRDELVTGIEDKRALPAAASSHDWQS